ncbi:hypothetical protein KAU19_00250 [Candidatus Parcubacteria bacterium]|nr:hypothetical protein [Candidatus Parcubacteria bacterium]
MKGRKIKLHKIVERFKKNNLFILIGVLLILLSSVITITQGFSAIKEQYEKSIGYKGKLLENLSQLSADVHIGYFTEILGNPVFVNNYDERIHANQELTKTNLTEYVFVNKYYFVQALTDNQGKVIVYTVTTRVANFNPKFKGIELGKTKFKDLGQAVDGDIVSYLGAHNFYYHETYWGANPGNYQTSIYALNEAGYAGLEEELESYTMIPPSKKLGEEILSSDPEIEKFRNNAIINTYGVSAPLVFFRENLNDFRFGPDYNQIRILPRN